MDRRDQPTIPAATAGSLLRLLTEGPAACEACAPREKHNPPAARAKNCRGFGCWSCPEENAL